MSLLVEWTWTLWAAGGVVVQLLLLRDIHGDRKALRLLGVENGRSELVRSHLRSGAIAVVMHCLFFLAGASALLEPDVVNGALSVDRFARIVALMVGQALLVTNGWLDLRARRRAREARDSDESYTGPRRRSSDRLED